MDLGYVDEVTREVVSGWAVDPARPDEPAEVMILVNGRKVAVVPCQLPRGDLRNLGIYGNGNHGFLYHFSPPLPDDQELRVAVRFAASGRPVHNGDLLRTDFLLKAGLFIGSPVASPPPFVAKAPFDPASLFRLLSLFEPERGLYELLCRLDFQDIRPAHLEYAAFGDVGAAVPPPEPWDQQAARDYLDELLHSDRFQQQVLWLLLRAFPEKRRVIFLHIPKCAGTDLLSHLAVRFPVARQHWREQGLIEREELFLALAEFVRELAFSDSLLVGGHIRLNAYLEEGLLRPADRIFTVLRDPIEIAISAINYILSKFQANIASNTMDADVKEWLAMLGMTSLPSEVSRSFANDVSRRALHIPDIVQPDSMCYWLGGGDADAVMARLARHHVEVTTTTLYGDWLNNAWGVRSSTRANKSTPFLNLSMLSHQDLEYVRGLSPEDQKLHDRVAARLTALGRTSLTGEELL